MLKILANIKNIIIFAQEIRKKRDEKQSSPLKTFSFLRN